MQVAVVTGASTGIGRATAVALGKRGWRVFLVARGKVGLEETVELVKKAGGEAIVVVGDLARVDSINAIVGVIEKQIEKLDLLANIAGIWHGDSEVYAGTDLEDFGGQVIVDTFMVGLVAPTLLVSGLLPSMQQGSVIVNLSGTFEDGGKGWIPYFASKRGLEDLTVGLADELKEKGIKVYGVSPSDVATEEYKKYFPEYAKEALSPDEVGGFVAGLVEDKVHRSGEVVVLKRGVEPRVGFHK